MKWGREKEREGDTKGWEKEEENKRRKRGRGKRERERGERRRKGREEGKGEGKKGVKNDIRISPEYLPIHRDCIKPWEKNTGL